MKLGLIGNDTSHVDIFSQILHDENNHYYIPSAKFAGFVEAFSEELEISASRAKGYYDVLVARGIRKYDTYEALANKVDGWMICTVHGDNHEQWFTKLAPYGKPIFIDKPLTLGVESAKRIIALAERYETPFFSASSLRFSEAISPLFGLDISKIYAYGPLPMQPAMPGYYWYGIHSLEWIEALIPFDLASIDIQKTANGEIVTLLFENGAHAIFDGDHAWHDRFGGTIFQGDEVFNFQTWKTEKPYYVSLMEQIISFMDTKKPPISYNRMLKIIQWIEAINRKRD